MFRHSEYSLAETVEKRKSLTNSLQSLVCSLREVHFLQTEDRHSHFLFRSQLFLYSTLMLFGLILVLGGSFFQELSSSIGKYEIEKKRESMYAMGFLSLIVSWLFFGVTMLFHHQVGFNPASLPSFLLRAGLEIFQIYVSLNAIALASRSTYSFIHIGTIPILLAIDIFLLQVPITGWQTIGIIAIVLALLILSLNHGIEKKGLLYVILSTVNGAATLTLFKFNITHFNSVEGEQFFLITILLIYLGCSAWFWHKEKPWNLLKKPVFFVQSATYGAGIVLDSFAYLFAATSIITVIKRALSVLWSVLAGHFIFKEKSFLIKFGCFVLITFGILLITKVVD